jgi:hypothetical protein
MEAWGGVRAVSITSVLAGVLLQCSGRQAQTISSLTMQATTIHGIAVRFIPNFCYLVMDKKTAG